jgi:hypothetical protein
MTTEQQHGSVVSCLRVRYLHQPGGWLVSGSRGIVRTTIGAGRWVVRDGRYASEDEIAAS